MQQTETYKLNKPGTGDPLTPAPLNENADKLDAALADHEQRVVALEGCRVLIGTYRGGLSDGIVNLGERPVGVLVSSVHTNNGYINFLTGDGHCTYSGYATLELVDNGFKVAGVLNFSNNRYSFVAFLGGWRTDAINEE